MMIGKMASDQGRARGLYDEQLQRRQQEKLLVRGAPDAAAEAPSRESGSALFGAGRGRAEP